MWELSEEAFKSRLRAHDFSHLDMVDIEDRRLNQVLRLGTGSAYYLGLVFAELSRPEMSAALFRLQAKKGDSPWAEESLVAGLQLLMDKKLYDEAEKLSRKAFRKAPHAYHRAQFSFFRLQALYRQEKDEELLAAADEALVAPYRTQLTELQIQEIALFQAVSTYRLSRRGWPERFLALFTEHPMSDIHIRAYRFLIYDPTVMETFTPTQQALLEGKYALAGGERARGIDLLEQSLGADASLLSAGTVLVQELGFAYQYAGDYSRGSSFLSGIASELPIETRLAAQEFAGRLARKAGNRQEARDLLLKTALATEDPRQRDRCLWFCLDIHLDTSIQDALEDIRLYGPLWDQADYFDDLLGELVTAVLDEGREEELRELAGLISEIASPAARLRLAYIQTRLIGSSPQADLLQTSLPKVTAEWGDVSHRYYGFLLALLNGDDLLPWLFAPEETSDNGTDATGRRDRKTKERRASQHRTTDAFALGFFDYGLYTHGYQWAVENPRALSGETLLAASRRLVEAQLYPEAMRLMSVSLAEERRLPNPEEARLLYPNAFHDFLKARSEEEDIPIFLLYSLVREESFFDPDSESAAGAVGLTQLMEVTALDMARLLGLEEIDRRDPETNLLLGSHHFGRLYRRLEDIPKTLAAYNAGLSRLRDWESRFADLPMDLFVEAIPFAETRHYIRKLLLSSVMYAWIYRNDDPASIARLFFPELPAEGQP